MNSEPPILSPAYLWFDTEFTGLDTSQARLLQVALLITDTKLNRLMPPSEDLSLCIRLEPDVVVSEWVEKNLAGLLARCRSSEAVSVEEADRRLSALVDRTAGPPAKDIRRRPVLAGNTVHMDLGLVRQYLPAFARRLHYRLLDVSALKVIWNDSVPGQEFEKDNSDTVRRHLPETLELPAADKHDAYYDIHASLAELNYYREKLHLTGGAACVH